MSLEEIGWTGSSKSGLCNFTARCIWENRGSGYVILTSALLRLCEIKTLLSVQPRKLRPFHQKCSRERPRRELVTRETTGSHVICKTTGTVVDCRHHMIKCGRPDTASFCEQGDVGRKMSDYPSPLRKAGKLRREGLQHSRRPDFYVCP